MLRRYLTPNSSVSVSPLPNLLWTLSSLGHDGLLSVSRRMAAGKHLEIHDIQQTKKMFHSSRVKLPLVNLSMSWFLVLTYFIWILGSELILSNQAQLCGFLTRVSSLDFCPYVQLRFSLRRTCVGGVHM